MTTGRIPPKSTVKPTTQSDATTSTDATTPASTTTTPTATTTTSTATAESSKASRSKAAGAEQMLRAKLDDKAAGIATLKEHHPLAQGDDSAEVKPEVEQVQKMLKDQGLYSGEITGKFDAATDKAVRAYQAKNGLKVDGIIGQQTWGSMLGIKAEPGLNLLKPWAHSFTHKASVPGEAPSASNLRSKALAMHGQAFLDKLDVVAGRIGVPADSMLKIMNNESGLRTDAVNPHGGATGLIQFMPATAKGLGTSTAALKNMSATEQLDFVEKYYAPFKGRLHSATDLYTATFYPAALGKPDDYVIGGNSAGLIARENPIFDIDGDGVITAQNFRDYCKRRFGE